MRPASGLFEQTLAVFVPTVGPTCFERTPQSPSLRYDPRELSDEELVARAHDELFHVTRAYEELMRRYQRTLFNVCLLYTSDAADE